MKPHSLLLLPKDPELLAKDPCGGVPPTAMHTGKEWLPGPVTLEGAHGWPVAIALAWEGKVLGLGCMRCWLASSGERPTPASLFTLVHATLGGVPDGVARLRSMLEDIGDVVGIDEHGRTIE